jgi:hypothetical protein
MRRSWVNGRRSLRVVAVMAWVVASHPSWATNCSPIAISSLGFSCQEITVQGTTSERGTVAAGVGMWQNGCNGGGTGVNIPHMQMPQLTSGPAAGPCTGYAPQEVLIVTVIFQATQPAGEPPRCGKIDAQFSHGFATIRIYNQANDGGDCSQRKSDTVAHELGHTLGLDDLSAQDQLACAGRIMSGNIFMSGQLVPRSVASEDCSHAHMVSNTVHPPSLPAPPGVPDPCQIY